MDHGQDENILLKNFVLNVSQYRYRTLSDDESNCFAYTAQF